MAGKAAAVINNTVKVTTDGNGVKVSVDKNPVNIIKNAAIDLATDKLAKGVGGAAGKIAAKTGLTKSNIVKTTKSALTAVGKNITRSTNNNVKAAAVKLVKGVEKGAETAGKAIANKPVENMKESTDQK
jgi:poly-gamma-glutamate capsule biosynthesis protein CapA/YwtB (metallophosphatase superfamily)